MLVDCSNFVGKPEGNFPQFSHLKFDFTKKGWMWKVEQVKTSQIQVYSSMVILGYHYIYIYICPS